MKDKIYKRKQIDWHAALLSTEDQKIQERYWLFKTKHLNWNDNRVAYVVLRHFFNKRELDHYRDNGFWWFQV